MPTSSASTTDSAKSAGGGVQSLERAFDLLERMADAGGEITAVLPYEAPVPEGARLEDFGDDVLLPGRGR